MPCFAMHVIIKHVSVITIFGGNLGSDNNLFLGLRLIMVVPMICFVQHCVQHVDNLNHSGSDLSCFTCIVME